MNTSSKILIGFAITLLALSISASYYRYVVLHDYMVKAEIDCDPSVESCFIYICDPQEETCTGDLEEDTWYYKYFYRNAKNIPLCDPYSTEDCPAFTCAEDESECYEETCSKNLLNEGEVCTRQSDFPAEEPFTETQGEESTELDTEKFDEIE